MNNLLIFYAFWHIILRRVCLIYGFCLRKREVYLAAKTVGSATTIKIDFMYRLPLFVSEISADKLHFTYKAKNIAELLFWIKKRQYNLCAL